MSEPLLIKSAITVSSDGLNQQDVLIVDGKIKELGYGLNKATAHIIDAEGLYLLPGVLDPHVHFRDPGLTWKEDLRTGSMAAVAGGVTSYFDMPNTKPSTINKALMEERKALAAEKSLVNYNFFMGATSDNLEDLNTVKNVAGIKIFMGSSTGDLLVSEPDVLEYIFSQGSKLIAVHAEDDEIIAEQKVLVADSGDFDDHRRIRPVKAALKATKLAVRLSIAFQRRLHILHLSTTDETAYLAKVKQSGPVSAEVCPQHFLLSAPEIYSKIGSLAQINPPLRSSDHGNALWDGLKQGVIDCIATDHAPHTMAEKDQPFGLAPSGMPGVETSLPLMLNRVNQGYCTLAEVVKWMCERPVELYGVKNKGHIAVGYDADLVLVDMKKKKTIENGKLHTKVNWSAFNGWETQGWPLITIVNGNIVYREGDFNEEIKGREILIDM